MSTICNRVLAVLVCLGWLSSFETYFQSWTKPTLDLVLQHLTSNPKLTFVWAEVIFLQRWYSDLAREKQEAFQRLAVFMS
jgi:Glycosyl hydrolases family 38 N-terminal domain